MPAKIAMVEDVKMDNKKIIEIGDQINKICKKFVDNINDIVQLNNKEYPIETSEAVMANLNSVISAIAGKEQAGGMLIMLLYRNYVRENVKEAMTIQQAQEMIKKLEGNKLDEDEAFRNPEDFINVKKIGKKEEIPKEKKPNYFG